MAEELYISEEDIFRLGNATRGRFENVRDRDVSTYDKNGVTFISARNQGISVYNKAGIDAAPMSGWVWRIPTNTIFPLGLTLITDNSGSSGHRVIAPSFDMPKTKYIGLLEELASKSSRAFRK